MIFAQITDRPSVNEVLKALERKFKHIEWGDQGTSDSPDAYFWVKKNDLKVSVDNLTSMEFQVKCSHSDSPLIQEVIDVLSKSFAIEVYEEPEYEAHE